MTQNGAHASKLTVAGTEYRIRRTFDLICRVEERFGEIVAFCQGASANRIKAAEIRDLYKILLADAEPAAPSDETIGQHIVSVGTHFALRPALEICGLFFMGEEQFMAKLQSLRAGNSENPPMPAGLRPGAN